MLCAGHALYCTKRLYCDCCENLLFLIYHGIVLQTHEYCTSVYVLHLLNIIIQTNRQHPYAYYIDIPPLTVFKENASLYFYSRRLLYIIIIILYPLDLVKLFQFHFITQNCQASMSIIND